MLRAGWCVPGINSTWTLLPDLISAISFALKGSAKFQVKTQRMQFSSSMGTKAWAIFLLRPLPPPGGMV